MDLNKIKYFHAVANTLNISKASKLVHLSQPALSIQIQNLEHELDLKLFSRTNRGLALTEEGKKLLISANELIRWQQTTLENINELKNISGCIKIGSYTTASSYLLPSLIAPFLKKHPEVKISYDYSDTDIIIEKIKNLELDCAIISEAPKTTGLSIKQFFSSELILVAAKKRKIPKKLSAKDIEDYPFLSYPLRRDYCYRMVEKKVGKHLAKTNVAIESTSFDTLKHSLLEDIGITFMPRYLIEKELNSGLIKEIQLKGLKLPIEFSIVTKKDKKISNRVKMLIDYIIK